MLERSMLDDNDLGRTLFRELEDPDLVGFLQRSLIIGEDGNCTDGFLGALSLCMRWACLGGGNPVCAGCTGAMVACVAIAIYNHWLGGRT